MRPLKSIVSESLLELKTYDVYRSTYIAKKYNWNATPVYVEDTIHLVLIAF